MLSGVILLVVGAILGPIVWQYSGSPERTKRWMIAASIGVCLIIPMRLIQARWPRDSGENYGALMLFLFGVPLAAAAVTAFAVGGIRNLQRKNTLGVIIAVMGVLLCVALAAPPFFK